MSNWEDDDGYCTTAADFQDARRVCEVLGIALHRVSFAEQYRERVFSSFPARICGGPHAESGCALQSRNQIRRLPGIHAAPGRRLDRHRPLCAGSTHRPLSGIAARRRTPPRIRAIFCTASRPPRSSKTLFPLGDLHKAQVRAHGACGRLAGIRQAGQHRHLFHRRAPVPGVFEPASAHRTGTDRDCRRADHRRASRVSRFTPWASAPAWGWAGARAPPPRPGTSRTKIWRATRSSWSRIRTIRCCLSDAFDVEQMHWINPGDAERAAARMRGEDALSAERSRLRGARRRRRLPGGSTLDRPARAVTPGQYAVFYQRRALSRRRHHRAAASIPTLAPAARQNHL